MRYEGDTGLFLSFNLYSTMGINIITQLLIIAWSTLTLLSNLIFYFSETELIGEVVTYGYLRQSQIWQ